MVSRLNDRSRGALGRFGCAEVNREERREAGEETKIDGFEIARLRVAPKRPYPEPGQDEQANDRHARKRIVDMVDPAKEGNPGDPLGGNRAKDEREGQQAGEDEASRKFLLVEALRAEGKP